VGLKAPDAITGVGASSGARLPRVLITNDRLQLRDVVDRALTKRCTCEFATDVEQAREMVSSATFDLVLCDLHAGGESARAFADEVVRGGLDTAVILLTDVDDPEHASSAFEFGAYGYLVNPPLPGHLLMTAMNALRRRELEIAHREHARHLEHRGQSIIDHAPMPIYAKDSNGSYVLSNAKADEVAGVDRGAMLGKADESIMPPEWAERSALSDHSVLTRGSIYEAKEVLVVDGIPRTYKTFKFPLVDESGEIDAVGGISTDITGELEAAGLRDELVATQAQAIEELSRSRRETVERLTRAIDQHDSSTGAHVNRMAAIAGFLAGELGLDPEQVDLLRAAAPMHDVGKIGTPDEILRKPGPLSPEERSVMETHTVIGHEILVDSESELLRLAATIALTHHENYDGSGYPQGLSGEQIPLEGRITAVADVFDALLSDRVYRPALSVGEAINLMKRGRGTQFDPKIVDLLLDRLDQALRLRGQSDGRLSAD
jgi:PAS domain S-box-containing protein